MDTPKPMIGGGIDNIEKSERIIDWVDTILTELVADTAAKIDHLQQGITFANGHIIKKSQERIKKEQQRIGRVITKLQKTVDYGNLSLGTTIPMGQPEVEQLMGDIPPSDVETNGGTLPSQPGVQPPALPLPSPDGCTPGSTYIDPDTCIIYRCNQIGVYEPIGLDSQCLLNKEEKGNPKGPPSPPPQPPQPPLPPDNQPSCPVKADWANRYYAGLQQIDQPNQDVMFTGRLYSPDVSWELSSNRYPYVRNEQSFVAERIDPNTDDGTLCRDQITTVVSIPYQRNQIEDISIYTEEGENYVRSLWRDPRQSVYSMKDYPTYESFVTSRSILSDSSGESSELGYVVFGIEQTSKV